MQFTRSILKSSLFLTLALSIAVTANPRRSDAIVGLVFANPVVVGTAAFLSIGGAAILISGLQNPPAPESRREYWISGSMVLFAGILLLDASEIVGTSNEEFGPMVIHFNEISSARAAECGVSDEDRETFNSELEQLDGIIQTIAANPAVINAPAGAPRERAARAAARLEYENGISAGTKNVIRRCL